MACASTRAMFLYGEQTLSVACGDIFPPAGGSLSTQVEALAEPVGEPLPAAPIGAASCSPFCRLVATSSPGRGKSFHSGGGLGKEGRFRPHSLTAGRSLPLSCKLFASAKASPFRERWHGEAVTERVCFRNEPSQSRCARQLSRRASPWQRGQVSSLFVNGRRSQPISGKRSAFAKASPFRERWHGEAVTERVPPRLAAAFGKRFFHGPAERPSSLESRY